MTGSVYMNQAVRVNVLGYVKRITQRQSAIVTKAEDQMQPTGNFHIVIRCAKYVHLHLNVEVLRTILCVR